MSTDPDTIYQKFLDQIEKQDDLSSEESANTVKNLKTFAEAYSNLKPEPEPVPEPTGFKGFLQRNSGDLIKVGGTLGVVTLISLIETKGDVIFRSKASKFI